MLSCNKSVRDKQNGKQRRWWAAVWRTWLRGGGGRQIELIASQKSRTVPETEITTAMTTVQRVVPGNSNAVLIEYPGVSAEEGDVLLYPDKELG